MAFGNKSKKRFLLGSTAALGIILATSSVAFACAVYRGQITTTGDGLNNASKSIVGDPGPSGFYVFQWCATSPDVPLSTASETSWASYWTTRVDDSLTISVQSSTQCKHSAASNQLPEGEYHVGISTGYWGEDDATDEDNCHSLLDTNVPNRGVIIDQPGASTGFDVNSSGVGSKTYNGTTLSNGIDEGAGWYTVCVFLDDGGPFSPANAANFKAV